MVTVLYMAPGETSDPWREAFRTQLPEADFRVWSEDAAADETGDPAEVDYAMVWKPKPGVLKTYPNLKAIFSMGAGVDHIWNDPELPDGVPIVRLVDRCLTQGMSEYVVYWTIHYHRKMWVYDAWRRENRWKRLRQADAEKRRVGILGLGELGSDAARKLVPLHYQVAGWSRSKKEIPGIESFHGPDQLIPFLNRTEILICLLPLTPDTQGIINKDTLAALPQGAFLINCARGGHVVDEDLLAAMDSGHIEGATLDVFHEEPLPQDHPFWTHPKVTVTPHMASLTVPDSSTEWYVKNIKRMEAGEPPLNTVDRKTRY